MAKKVFNREYLLEDLDLPYNAIERKIIDRTRWSIIYEMIFEDNEKFYRCIYLDGATEYQDQDIFDDEKEIECEEVEKKVVQREEWMPV